MSLPSLASFAQLGFIRAPLAISTNFPLSSYDNVDKLKLTIVSIGEVELIK